jgi:hypothetical protein
MDYRYALDAEVAEVILSLSSRQRREFVKVFRALAANPHQRGEQTFCDSHNREIQKRRFGLWLISYWPDHAVKEVRIVGVQRAK